MALTGFVINGTCSPDTNSAVVKFAALFPVIDTPNLTKGLVYPSSININASGLVTYSLKYDNGLSVATNLTEQLLNCDPNFDPDPFSVTYAFVVFSFFYTGIVLNYMLTNQIGTVINFIKKV